MSDADTIIELGDQLAAMCESLDDLKQQLAASEEARKMAEALADKNWLESVDGVVALRQRAEAAKKLIEDRRKQEPFAHFIMHNGCAAQISREAIGLEDIEPFPLYKQPPIPPELSEVMRERDELKDTVQSQLGTIKSLNSCLGGEGSLTTDNLTRIARLENKIEELNRLLSEARKVPEGWKLVPVEPTDNGVGGMVNAGAIALKQHDDTPFMENRTGIAKSVYKAMLSASPTYKEQP